MNLIHKARTSLPTAGRHLTTKANAILSWELRHPSATPEQREIAMKQIDQRYKGRS
jgi:hypothetical protein